MWRSASWEGSESSRLTAVPARFEELNSQDCQLIGVASSPMSTTGVAHGSDRGTYGSPAAFSRLRGSSGELSPINSDPSSPRSRVTDVFSASMVSNTGYVHIEDDPEAPFEHDNLTSQALFKCKQKVLKPYLRLLSFLGWHPIISGRSDKWWARMINAVYPMLVVVIIVLGYIVQYALCYRRLPNRFDKEVEKYDNITFNKTVVCSPGVFTNYIIPDLLHAAAFLYSFYVIRWKENEHMVTLMERVFLQTSSTHPGWLSQPRLIKVLRTLLWLNVIWVVVSLCGHALHVTALTYGEWNRYNPHFMLFHATNSTAHYALLGLLLAGLLAMDIVYASVVTNYAIQCHLLITHMRCTVVRTRQKLVSLPQAMKDISDEVVYLRTLNDKVATAVSLLLFNVMSLFVLRLWDLLEAPLVPLYLSASVVRTAVMLALLALPLVQACRVTNAGYALQRLGLEVAVRPFGYQDTPDAEIYSFQLFTSCLQPRAKLFRVPIHASWVMSISLTLTFALLVALQLDLIETSF